MAFKAQRDGTCSKCQKSIKIGEYISWRRTKTGPGSGEAWHFPTCSTAAVNTPTIKTDETQNGNAQISAALAQLQAAILAQKSDGILTPETTDEILKIVNDTLDKRLTSQETNISEIVHRQIASAISGESFLSKPEIESLIKTEIEAQTVKKLVIEQDGREIKTFDLAHQDLPVLIKLANTRGPAGHRLNLYMHGPAGSGKSTAARQTADALGLRFGYSSLNPMTPDSRALGFIHAGGSYVGTEFFKCYTEGGVFCFDEIDNASASFVTTLNSTLENGHGAFPHGIYARHKDFLCVCTANTIGRGGDIHYPERRALDSAFLERFVFVEWGYDQKLTRAIVGGILGDEAQALMDWVDKLAIEYRTRFPELVISPRAYIQSALLTAQGFPKTLIESACISRGLKNA